MSVDEKAVETGDDGTITIERQRVGTCKNDTYSGDRFRGRRIRHAGLWFGEGWKPVYQVAAGLAAYVAWNGSAAADRRLRP